MTSEKDLKSVESPNAPAPIGPYSQAVQAGEFLFVSGQIPIDAKTGEITGSDIVAQTHQVISNIEAILASTGLDLADVVKAEVFMTDLSEFSKMNKVYTERFTGKVKPSRFVVEVSSLPKSSLIEIACTAKVS